ncbi:MAG: hypothetical protein KAG53_04070 [Endozoicomonadaceae bacterium]|nr:hypothetical protein [Endozoicomonadaceae bacterium]
MTKIIGNQGPPLTSDVVSKQQETTKIDETGQFKDKSINVEKNTTKIIDSKEKSDVRQSSDHSEVRTIRSRAVAIRQPVKKICGKNTGEATGIFEAKKNRNEQNKPDNLSSKSIDGEKQSSNKPQTEGGHAKANNDVSQGGLSRNSPIRRAVKRRRMTPINEATTNLKTKQNNSTATKQQDTSLALSKGEEKSQTTSKINDTHPNKGVFYFAKKALDFAKSKVRKLADRLVEHTSTKHGNTLSSPLNSKDSRPELAEKALNDSGLDELDDFYDLDNFDELEGFTCGLDELDDFYDLDNFDELEGFTCGLDELKELQSEHLSPKHQSALMMRVSDIFDGYTIEELKEIEGKDTPKEWVSCINGKLIKRQIEQNSKNKKTEMFRVPGATPSVNQLNQEVSNKLFTELKNNHGNSTLEDVNALAGHVKKRLIQDYQIKGTTEESYTTVFNQLKSWDDKMMFFDVLNAMHAFCLQAKEHPSTTQNLNNIAIGIMSLYGGDMDSKGNVSVDRVMAIQKAGSMEKSQEVQKAIDINISTMEEFLKNWPIAKAKMNF